MKGRNRPGFRVCGGGYTMNSQSNEKNMDINRTNQSTPNIRWMLVGYDLVVYAVVAIILLVLYGGMDKLSPVGIFQQVGLSVLCIFAARLLGKIYGQVWRYGGIQCYIRLLFTDMITQLYMPQEEKDILENLILKNFYSENHW